ncbi:MAG: hypothetical protein ACOWWH_00830 [Eubacteriaceae bacterium]
MPGYVINLDNLESMDRCILNGIYSTRFKRFSKEYWLNAYEATFADYISMKHGDNIYFFCQRNIYGIGALININEDCKYLNYPQAIYAKNFQFQDIQSEMLFNNDETSINNRFLCLFEPLPYFFKKGIDMDDVLASNPKSFRMLRAFQRLSFVKIDDEENKALKDIILKRNEDALSDKSRCFTYNEEFHFSLKNKLNNYYNISSTEIIKQCNTDEYVKHEMALEAGLVEILCTETDSVFDKWDYISHQVIASPFKPVHYMDKMDIFGYRYIEGYDTISKYLIIEVKKGTASCEVIEQIMKYVDWVNQEYSYNDYSTINAFVVAYDFPQNVIDKRNKVCIRNYTKGRRPTISDTWTNVKLVKYKFDESTGKLILEEVG